MTTLIFTYIQCNGKNCAALLIHRIKQYNALSFSGTFSCKYAIYTHSVSGPVAQSSTMLIQFSDLGPLPSERHLQIGKKVQRLAARFISVDYTSRDHGCFTQMLTKTYIFHNSIYIGQKANHLMF